MLQNWIKPIDKEQFLKVRPDEEALPCYTSFFQADEPIDNHSVALLGLNEVASLKIRTQLYQFNRLSGSINFIDLGIARNQTEEFLTGLLTELRQSKITSIVFGTPDHILNAQILSNREIQGPLSLGIVDVAPEYHAIDAGHMELLDRIVLMGTQKHLFRSQQWSANPRLEVIRMGILKNEILEAEPALRDCQALSFSIRSLNKREAPAQRNISNTKISAYEACQLMHFLGFNENLNSIAFTHYVPELDMQDMTAHLIAQMIWYYLDARSLSIADNPEKKQDVQEFSVVLDQFGLNVSFVKSLTSGKWWIKTEDGNYIPCTQKDYELACSNTLSPRVFHLYS